MAGQPQSYGSIREFLDNLPSQPCIWQPENANICVTCLRINEPVARVCSVWAQALEEAPLEEIDFEEEVKSFPSVVEIEDEFEMVIPIASPVVEVDIVEATSDWDMVIEDSTDTTEEIAEAVIEAATDATEEVVENVVIEHEEIAEATIAIEATEEIAEATIAIEATEEIEEATIAVEATEEIAEATIAVEATEEIAEATIAVEATEEIAEATIAVEATEEIAEATIAVEATEEIAEATIAVEATEKIAEAVVEAATDATEEIVESVVIEPEEIEATEEITLNTIQDAMNAENIAKENKEIAAETEVVAAEAVIEALNTETEAVEAYAEAVKEEVQAADAVVEAAEAKNVATEAVIESVEEVTELMDNEAKEDEIKEAETELKENMEKQQEAEKTLVEAITNEDIAAEEVETTSSKEDQASDNLEKAIEADEKASDDLEDAITREEKAEEEVQEVVETSKTIKSVHEETPNDSKPFLKDDKVTHGVYGNGTVLQLNKAGKHWSVEVDFKEGKRRILGTFLTLNEVSESHIEKQEPDEESFKKPESKDVAKIQKVEENSTQITEVVTESVETDYGEYPPGTKISHDIFGKGEVKNSKPKGEAYRLDLFFEDGSERTLLSTFVKLEDETLPEAETVEAEPVEAETVLDTDIIYQRPKKGKEVILDLSKPEVQDAEMIDDED